LLKVETQTGYCIRERWVLFHVAAKDWIGVQIKSVLYKTKN